MSLRSPDVIEKRLLEEYREQSLFCRHDSESFSKLTNVLLPLSIGALTLPYLKVESPKILATVGGLMLMSFWFFSFLSFENRLGIRWSRIHEIERILGFDSHLRIDRKRRKNVLKIQHLRYYVFIIYLAISLFVMCDIKIAATDLTVSHRIARFIHVLSNPKVDTTLWSIDVWSANGWIIKLAVTAETIAFLLIVGTIAIVATVVCTCIWAWKRVDKRTENMA